MCLHSIQKGLFVCNAFQGKKTVRHQAVHLATVDVESDCLLKEGSFFPIPQKQWKTATTDVTDVWIMFLPSQAMIYIATSPWALCVSWCLEVFCPQPSTFEDRPSKHFSAWRLSKWSTAQLYFSWDNKIVSASKKKTKDLQNVLLLTIVDHFFRTLMEKNNSRRSHERSRRTTTSKRLLVKGPRSTLVNTQKAFEIDKNHKVAWSSPKNVPEVGFDR